ncbi:MAG: cellulase family glycosylhydrolase [Erysipelotrichaceae bacterium]|nr:cellulase family glycosylhydrolase [Erysipelotrichaceae bacterium]
MKKLISFVLIAALLLSGCSPKGDGKDRPSNSGQLKVQNNILVSSKGKPVQLRGISMAGIAFQERYTNDDTFKEIAATLGCNVIRLAMYTWGVGAAGYSTGGNKKQLKEDILKGVECAKNADMYAMVDWHVLQDRDPNKYIEDAKDFFDEVSLKLKDYDNVIYEICNEPNNCEWSDIKAYADVIIPIIRNNDPDALIIVGTPEWSSDLYSAANDPLDYDNLMYTFHFYAASHNTEYRNRVSYAVNTGLPVFVTEFGITSANGGYPVDIDEANTWVDFLEENNISYIMWNFSTSTEPCAAIKSGTLKTSGFTDEEITEAGHWLIDTINKYNSK